LSRYINRPQPEKFPLAVKLWVNEPGQECIKEDTFRKHEFSELIFVRKGTAEHRIGSKRFPLETGDVVIVHPGTEDAFSKLAGFEMLAVIFDSSAPLPIFEGSNLPLVEQIYPRNEACVDQLKPIVRVPFNDRELCENLIRRLSYETHRKRLGRNIMIPLIFTELVVYFARGDSMEEEKELLWLIQSPAEYLNEHYQELLDLKKLEKLARMSERSLFRHFQRTLGMSPNRYLHKIRIQKACELLARTQTGIGEIALQCGFCDGNHLTKVFHSIMGTTPFAFRRNVMGK